MRRVECFAMPILPKKEEGSETMKAECWCYTTERTVTLNGETVGKRQAELFRVDNCQHGDCPKRLSRDCLIGKVLEGRWP